MDWKPERSSGATVALGGRGWFSSCVFSAAFPVYVGTMGLATCSVMETVRQESRELAGGLRRRDPSLIEQLIQQYHYRLFRYLLMLTGNR